MTACRLLGVRPSESVAIEDSAAGVAAAVSAGVGRVIGLAATTSPDALVAAGAHQVVSDLRRLALH